MIRSIRKVSPSVSKFPFLWGTAVLQRAPFGSETKISVDEDIPSVASRLNLNAQDLLANNKRWAAKQQDVAPEYFQQLSRPQTPKFFWVGCSDARVEANRITGLLPGDLLVHRNVANVVSHTDINFMSVLQFAVQELHIPDVIVCGHTQCGGVGHSLTNKYSGTINHWLRNVKDVYEKHAPELDSLPAGPQRQRRLEELNVIASCRRIAQTGAVQELWNQCDTWGQPRVPRIHGWVFDLESGLLKDLEVDAAGELSEIHTLTQFKGKLSGSMHMPDNIL